MFVCGVGLGSKLPLVTQNITSFYDGLKFWVTNYNEQYRTEIKVFHSLYKANISMMK
jgi:hypothetical protein